MKPSFSKIFQNKFVLYGVSIFAVSNVLGYLAKEQYNAATFFLAIGLLTSYFTKNMTVVLLTAIVTTALFSSQKLIEGFKEGATGATTGAATTGAATTGAAEPSGTCTGIDSANDGTCSKLLEETTCEKNADCGWNLAVASGEFAKAAEEATNTASTETPVGSDATGSTNTTVQQGSSDFAQYCLTAGSLEDHTHTQGEGTNIQYFKSGAFEETCGGENDNRIKCGEEGDCSGYTPVGEKFTNMGKRNNIVGSVARETRVDGVDESVGDRIDHAATTKQAFQNLQRMLGSDGMKGLAAETKNLVSQQKELVDSLGQMAPVLKSAKTTLDSLNLPDMKGLTSMLSTLKGGN